jgi:hypothetical protein
MKRAARYSVESVLCLLAMGLWAGQTLAQDSLPQRTEDGLERVQSERMDVVYWRPGASLARYKRIMLLECTVAFVKDWEQERNQAARRSVYRADAEDMQRIRTLLAEGFRKEFTRELEERGGYEIVDVAAEDVLLLRPSIVDLDVTAPVLPIPGQLVNYVATTGEMTLHLELHDSATNSLIGRAIDRGQGSETGGLQISDSVTNQADAVRILREWAATLRNSLDEQWSGPR